MSTGFRTVPNQRRTVLERRCTGRSCVLPLHWLSSSSSVVPVLFFAVSSFLRSRPGSLSLFLSDLSFSLFATVLSSDSCAMRLLLLFSLLSLLEQESAGFSSGGGFNDGILKSALARFVRRNFASRVFVVLVAVFVARQSVSSIAVRFE